MKKSYKNISYLIAGFLLLILLFANFSENNISAFASSVYRGDYVCIYYDVNTYSGKVSWSLEFGLNTTARGLKNDEKDVYHTKIREMVQDLFNDKKAELQAIYNEKPEEKYNPVDCITHSIGAVFDEDADTVSFIFQFKDIDTYNFYNKKDEDKVTIEKNLFLNKQTVESLFPFAELMNDGSNNSLATHYKKEFISACHGLSIENSIKLNYNPDFIYDYATTSSRLRSDADLTYTDASGKYHHAWGEVENNINSNFVITKSLVKVNTGWWYLLAISVPLVIMGIVIVVIVIKDKMKKQKKDEKTA